MLHTPTRLTDLSPHFSKWEARRREAETITEVLRTGTVSHRVRADRIAQCSTFLELYPLDTPDGRQHWIAHTRRCRDRLCSICQVSRTVWWRARCQAALRQLLTAHPDAVGIAFTFTVRNSTIFQLRHTLRWMSKSWAAMIRRPPWPEHYGWLRVTEVTRGDDGTAHPHYHILLLVPNQYFESTAYLDQREWTALWQRFLKVRYRPRVNVRRVKPHDLDTAARMIERGQRHQPEPDPERRDRVQDSVCEQYRRPSDEGDAWRALSRVIDYELKPDDLVALSEDPEWFLTLADQLTHIRTVEVGGALRKVMATVTKELRQAWQRTHATVEPGQGTNWRWQKKAGYVKAYGGHGQSRGTADGRADGQTHSRTSHPTRMHRSNGQPAKTAGQGQPARTRNKMTPVRSGSPTGTTPHGNPSKHMARKASRSNGSRAGQPGVKPGLTQR